MTPSPRAALCLLFIVLTTAAFVAPQAGNDSSTTAPAQTPTTNASPTSSETPRRVVDTRRFPPKGSWPGRVVLAPFRAIAPGMEHGLARFEEARMWERIRIYFENPYIRPLFGGLGDGSGLGGGVGLGSGDAVSKSVRLLGTAHLTSKRYAEATLGFRVNPTSGAMKALSLEVVTDYQLRPQEDFWGIGPSATGPRTTYYLQERGVSATAMVKRPKWFSVGLALDYSGARVFEGRDARFPTTQQVFGSTNLPGLTGADLLGVGPVIELELRDQPGNPRAGAFLHLSATSNDGTGTGNFAFWSYLGDARAYLPLGTKRRVLAFRVLGNVNQPKGNAEIPFFRLARLGDQHTLRGFETYRFHGRNAFMTSAEYRYHVLDFASVFAFTDAGQVFNHRSEWNAGNMRISYGGGLLLHDKKSVLFKLLYARGDETARLFFNFGPTF